MLPEGWKTYNLSDLIILIGGGTPKTDVAEYWNGSIPWLSVVDFNSGNKHVYRSEKSITEKGLQESATKILKKGQIIISARGTVGEMALLGRDMAFNQSCYGIVANNKAHNDFLFYLLKSSIQRIKKKTHGAVFDTITKQTFDNISVTIPDNLSEQSRIASILSSLDDKIELNLQMNLTLEAIAQAIFKEWFVDFRFPGFDGALVDGLPKSWRSVPISSMINVKDGTHNSPKPTESGRFLITSKHLKDNYIDFNEAYFISNEDFISINKRSKVDSGDVLITMIGTVGNYYFVHESEVDFAIKNIGLFKTSERTDLQGYLYFFLKSEYTRNYFQKRQAGSTQQYLTLDTLRSTPIVLPETRLVVEYNDLSTNILTKIKNNQREIEILSGIRELLLPKLMTGKIQVAL